MTSLVAQLVKNLPTMQETRVQSLGQEDPLEKEMSTHSSIFAWRIPCTEEPGGLQSMESQRVRHDWATNTFFLSPSFWSPIHPPPNSLYQYLLHWEKKKKKNHATTADLRKIIWLIKEGRRFSTQSQVVKSRVLREKNRAESSLLYVQAEALHVLMLI